MVVAEVNNRNAEPGRYFLFSPNLQKLNTARFLVLPREAPFLSGAASAHWLFASATLNHRQEGAFFVWRMEVNMVEVGAISLRQRFYSTCGLVLFVFLCLILFVRMAYNAIALHPNDLQMLMIGVGPAAMSVLGVACIAVCIKNHIEATVEWHEKREVEIKQEALEWEAALRAEIETFRRKRQEGVRAVLSSLSIQPGQPGFIYVIRRDDGIYKVGYTDNTNRRIAQHESDYGAKFTLIKRFAVADKVEFEKLALIMTEEHVYREPGRVELRSMTDEELNLFLVEFEAICSTGVTL